jgi:hypothetical protein
MKSIAKAAKGFMGHKTVTHLQRYVDEIVFRRNQRETIIHPGGDDGPDT